VKYLVAGCFALAFAASAQQDDSFAQRMTRMTQGLSGGTLQDFGGITCWTCHRGNTKPARMPREGWQDQLAHWPEALKLSREDARKPAGEVYRNLRVLATVPAGSIAMNMSIYGAALGVTCEHCHVPGEWASDEKAAKRTARKMLGLFTEIPAYFDTARQPSMQCYTCHQGSVKPQRQPQG
jgi:hypothetical protein